MQALGNDYVYIDGFLEEVKDPSELSRKVSNRNTGVGSDGLILILPSEKATCRMQMFNPDGSEGEVCGNGLRCIAKFVYEAGYTKGQEEFEIDTAPGIRRQWVKVRDGKVYEVTSEMGRPGLTRKVIPMKGEGSSLQVELPLAEETVQVNGVSLGNPHVVMFVDDVDSFPCEKYGPQMETHDWFPERANVEFVEVVSRDRIKMRIWERGTGMTLASGSGSTASAVASVETGLVNREVTVEMPLGELKIEYPENGDLLMTGPAYKVFEGIWIDD